MEPKRPIERLLEAYAQRRRRQAGPPFEPHPASRRLWAGEVNRQFAGARRAPDSRGWLQGWLPRLAWSLAILAVLGVGTWFFSTGGNQPLAELAAVKDLRAPTGERQDKLLTRQPAPAAAAVKYAAPAESSALGVAVKSETPAPGLAGQRPGSFSGTGGGATRERVLAPASPPASALAESLTPAASSGAFGGFFKEAENAPTTNLGYGLASAAAPTLPAVAATPVAIAPTNLDSVFVTQAETVLLWNLTNNLATAASAVNKDRVQLTEVKQAPTQPLADASAGEGLWLARTASPKLEPALGTQAGVSDAEAGKLPLFLKEKASPAFQQQFVQVANDEKSLPANRRQLAASPILNNFTVEQTGTRWRVIDEDGSVYLGDLRESQSAPRASSPKAAAKVTRVTGSAPAQADASAVRLLTEGSSAQAGRFFRVVGTNRSLNQQVVFSGTILPPPEAAGAAVTNAAPGLGGQFKAFNQAVPAQNFLQQSQIRGKAQIGGQREIEINAAPAKP